MKIFVISDNVLRPDIYTTSFLAVTDSTALPETTTVGFDLQDSKNDYVGIFAIIIGSIIVGTIVYFGRKRKSTQNLRH